MAKAKLCKLCKWFVWDGCIDPYARKRQVTFRPESDKVATFYVERQLVNLSRRQARSIAAALLRWAAAKAKE